MRKGLRYIKLVAVAERTAPFVESGRKIDLLSVLIVAFRFRKAVASAELVSRGRMSERGGRDIPLGQRFRHRNILVEKSCLFLKKRDPLQLALTQVEQFG